MVQSCSQDTNTTQYELMRYIAQTCQCVTIVGDPDQSSEQGPCCHCTSSLIAFQSMDGAQRKLKWFALRSPRVYLVLGAHRAAT